VTQRGTPPSDPQAHFGELYRNALSEVEISLHPSPAYLTQEKADVQKCF